MASSTTNTNSTNSSSAPAPPPASKLSIRVKSKKSQNAVLRDVDPQESIQNLIVKLSDLTGVPEGQVAILKGFPPKRIPFRREDLVESLGLQQQDTIIVELDTGIGEDSSEAEAGVVGGGNAVSTSSAVLATTTTTGTNNGATSAAAAAAAGAATSSSDTPQQSSNGQSSNSVVSGNNEPPAYVDLVASDDDALVEEDGLLLRQVVPSDNSCLFTSVTFCLSGQVQTDADAADAEGGSSAFLRELIGNTVAADTTKYNQAMLGRPNEEYVNWIKKPESWGGGIELSILAEFYGIQICVIDTQSLHISCFGEDMNYPQRMFLIYDGIHYDPLYFEPFSGGAPLTMHPTASRKMMELAKQLAKEAKASNQYTDLKNFALRCQVCNKLLKGEEEAQAHAKKTAHASFAEIQQQKS